MDISSFGEKIKIARDKQKLELKDVQAETGIDASLLCRLEKGERLPTKEQVFHLADFFKIDRCSLLIAWKSDKIYSIIKEQEKDNIHIILDVIKERIKVEK